MLAVLAADRQQVLKDAVRLEKDQFSRPPHPGSWSMSELLTHILTTEKLSLQYMQKKSLGIATAGNSGVTESIKMVLMKIIQRIPMRYKAPRAVVTNTPPPLSLEVIGVEWETFMNDLTAFLQTIDAQHVRRKIYKHPVFGRLDAHQALISMHEHFRHHLPQIRRLLK